MRDFLQCYGDLYNWTVKINFNSINNKTPTILSVFAGRIADTGIDPTSIMKECIEYTQNKKILKYYG